MGPSIRIAVPREQAPGETRVAMTPDAIRRLASDGLRFVVERGAGEAASFSDDDYQAAGADLAPDAAALFSAANAAVKLGPPVAPDLLPEGCVLVGLLRPHANAELLERLARRGVTAMALELMPRVTRAQRMDALSAMSTVAGYAAVLLAAGSLGKFFPLLMTAAGTIPPSRVLVLGAGVAGLQAIATARRLGAVVEAFDIRPAVKEQVESLGATFVEEAPEGATGGADGTVLAMDAAAADATDQAVETEGGYATDLAEDRQARDRRLIGRHLDRADVCITTALIPGRPAPLLITADMVETMVAGSVIVDLAGEAGGNCELSEHGPAVTRHGVTIHCPLEPAAALPVHASQMYARVLSNLLGHLIADGALRIDLDDEITGAICVTHGGKVRFPA